MTTELMTQNNTMDIDSGIDPKVSAEPEMFKKPLMDRALESLASFASISSLMRICGAIALLAAMSMFLLQGWGDQNDFERFLTMVGQTSLLGLAGFAMVKLLKEVKGARLFFGLALVSISANFTTLGALIYSLLSFDGMTAQYADYAFWQASSGPSTMIATLLSFVILTPLAWLGFSVLARPSAKKLTVTYMGLNALLLMPVRDVTIIVALVAAACFMLVRKGGFKYSLNMNDETSGFKSWSTLEGKFAHLILTLPLIIMMVRSFLHYDISTFAWFVLSASAYALFIKVNAVFESRYEFILLGLASASAVFMAGSAFFLIGEFSYTSDITSCLVFSITFFAAMLMINRLSTGLIVMGSKVLMILFSLIPMVLFHLLDSSTQSFIYALIIALMFVATGKLLHSRLLLIAGLITVLVLPMMHINILADLFFKSGWMGYAVAGVVTIVCASLLERYGAIIAFKAKKSKEVAEL